MRRVFSRSKREKRTEISIQYNMKRVTKKRLEVISQDNVFVFRAMHGPELLIQTVEKYPCLWDTRIEHHYRKEEREAAWKKVCEKVYDDWHLKDENEKKNKSAELKKKWTHIRDYYRRDLMRIREMPAGIDVRRLKRYVFADMLHFLTPLYEDGSKNAEKSANFEYDSSTQEEFDDKEILCFDDDEKLSSITELPTAPSTSHSSVVGQMAGKRKATQSSEALKILQPELNAETESDDTKFLLSLRGDLSQLNHGQKLQFKIGILQLLQNIMYTDQAKKSKMDAGENEAEHVMSTVLKMSPVFQNENSQNDFDNNGF